MPERPIRGWFEVLRWVSLAVAVAVLVIFLGAQQGQSIDVSYGRSPASSNTKEEGAAGELGDATVPSVREMTNLVRADDVVRLPGSVASWDESRVREAIGDSEIRILVAPPGLDADERKRIRAVEDATIRVIGTQVSGGMYRVAGDSLAEWRAQFATGDVTDHLLALIATIRDEPSPPEVDQFRWRDPSDAEIAAVATDLRASGLHVADGATLTKVPADAAATAFPDQDALYVALAQQPYGEPVPRYGPALVKLFPDTPIVVLYGSWIEYHGPHEEDFADVVGATFYGQLGDRLSRYSYSQDNVLFGYLNRVTDVRYAGLFDRPLPYQPVDPLRVALPALPWLFAGCVVLFLAMSVRALRPATGPVPGQSSSRRIGMPARLAGLTALAIEVSGLTGEKSNAALTRGITKLRAARDALEENLPDRHVRSLLNDAEAEFDDVARILGRTDYRPTVYLRGRLA